MADKKFVGTFQNETEVLNKIDELKMQGYSDDDIYIVTNDADRLSIVRGETDVDLRDAGRQLDGQIHGFSQRRRTRQRRIYKNGVQRKKNPTAISMKSKLVESCFTNNRNTEITMKNLGCNTKLDTIDPT